MEDNAQDQEKETWVSVADAADNLGCDKETIRRYLRDGKLIGKKNPFTGVWRISASSLINLMNSKRSGE